jgi:alkaline phosphatase D
MPAKPVPVEWRVAEDEQFRRVVAAGAEVARPERAHSVDVEVSGLRPGAEYGYRFRVERN